MCESDLVWAVERWKQEVLNRPHENIHRRTLDETWRQVIRRLGGNDVELLGDKPFWPKCGLCGKPILLESDAEEFWTGPINAPGGEKGYIHVGRGTCLKTD